MSKRLAFILCASVPAIACLPSAASAQPSSPVAQDEAAKLKKLFAESDEDSLRRNPINAVFRGDMRFADRLGDYVSDAYFAAERRAVNADLVRLAKIDRTKLGSTDQISYDVFKWQQEQAKKTFSAQTVKLTAVRPLNHFSGFQTFYPTFSSGQSAAPFKTMLDYDNNLKRHRDYIVLMDRAIGQFRVGMKTGVVETKMTVRNMIEQMDAQLKQPLEESPFFGPAKAFPADFSENDKARLTADYKAVITSGLYPAYKRMRDFLATDYLPKARDGVGLIHMRGGPALYRELVEGTTTVKMEPDAIHDLGLSEVKRILTAMEAVRAEVSFKGKIENAGP